MAIDQETRKSTNLIVTLVSVVTAAGIFFLDIFLPLGVAAGVPYVGLVMISLYAPWRNYSTLLASISTLLIFVGYMLSPTLAVLWVVVTNRLLAVLVVWITAEFCRRRIQSEG